MVNELREMQKDTFRWLIIVTWGTSLFAVVALTLTPPENVLVWLTWIAISPLALVAQQLARRHFRVATWAWVCGLVILLALAVPWRSAPNLGASPYTFVLVVVMSGLLISRGATLGVAALASVISVIALGVLGEITLESLTSTFPPLLMAWSTAGMSWVASEQLVTALTWTRDAQVKARERAEELRISRDALARSLLIRDNLNTQLHEANEELTQRAVQMETVAEVGRQVSSLLDLEQLLNQVTDLICDTFDYYHVGVFLIDVVSDCLVLRAAGGAQAESILAEGLCLPMDRESINGCAAVDDEVQRVDNVSSSSCYQAVELLEHTVSELVLPLKIGRRIVGTLDVQSDRFIPFSRRQHDVESLRTLAAQIAIAIQNASLYQTERSRRRFAETLYEVGRVLTGTLDLSEVLDLILEHMAEIVPYDRASVMLHSGETLEIVAARGFPSDAQLEQLRISIEHETEEGIFQQISRSQKPLILNDASERPDWQDVDGALPARAWLGVPLIRHDEVIGFLSLTRETADAYGEEDGTLVATFAGQAAIALENARLYARIVQFNLELEQTVQERTEALRTAYHQLEQLDRTKTDFIGVISHELRTPLTVLKGYSQMLVNDGRIKESDYHQQLVTGIHSGAIRMHEIVNSMLDMLKIDSRALELYPEPVLIPSLLQPLCKQFASALEERHLTLEITNMSDLAPIEADPDALAKVFYHLLSNAIKYTPDHGRISVSGHTADGVKEEVEIVVSDTGIGIDPESHELIFTKFYQTGQVALHSSGQTKFKGGGPGLGLAIAQGIVKAHGGRVWVESPGCDEETCPGSAFHVVLPVRQNAPHDLQETE